MKCKQTEDERYRNFNGFLKFFEETNADILCLQEVKPIKRKMEEDEIEYNEIKKDCNYEYMLGKMKEIGYGYSCIIDGNPGMASTEDKEYFMSHNAIFSKLPITDYEAFSLPGNRSFMVCNINDFIIVNFHGEVSTKKTNKMLEKNNLDPTGPYGNLLQLEINLMLIYLGYYHSTSNIVFAGDFNYSYETIKKYTKYLRFSEIKAEDIYKDFLLFFHDTNEYDLQKRITNFNSFNATDFIFINDEIKKKV